MIRLKICCIASIAEAALAVRHGASALGLVSRMPSGPGVIDEHTIAEVAAWAPPGVATFLLTSLQDGEAIADQARRCRTSTVQLCDAVAPREIAVLRGAHPALKIVQVIHVLGEQSLDEAREAAPHVDALLLDSGNPALEVKQLGGTGRVHDWAVSRRIVESVGVPVYLAGGLNAANAGEAVRAVRPFGLDVCSGVRADGRLDEAKLQAFVAAAREAADS